MIINTDKVNILHEIKRLTERVGQLEVESKNKDIIISELKNKISAYETQILKLEALVKHYEEQLLVSKRREFGVSSEKNDVKESCPAFNEAEKEADGDVPEPELKTVAPKRRGKKRIGKRTEDLESLERQFVEHVLPEDKRFCSKCNKPLHQIKWDSKCHIEIIPAKAIVVEDKTAVYGCRNCDHNSDDGVTIIRADSPEPFVRGSIMSPSAVAHIMTMKYLYAVPLYRLEQAFTYEGIPIVRQNMSNWIIRCTQEFLSPIYEVMKRTLLSRDIIHADETVCQVINEAEIVDVVQPDGTICQVLKNGDKKATSNSYIWLYRTSGDTNHSIVIYEYQPTRDAEHAKEFLQNFFGYVHCDGYAGYHNLHEGIIPVGCCVHVRRKFYDAAQAVPKEKRVNSLPQKAVDYIDRLFDLERKFKVLSPEKRFLQREDKSKPIMNELYEWANSIKLITSKSLFGVALNYLKNQKEYLMNFFLDGRLELSNNRGERSVKPFVIGRKNWLFFNTPNGARASQIVYSIIETAKENGLNPYQYIKFLLETVPNTPVTATLGNFYDLLPWGNKIPDYCKTKVIPRNDSS